MDDDLFARAERARSEAIALSRRLAALRELRTLERDFRAVTRELALTMSTIELPGSPDGLRCLLMEAEEASQFDNWA
jgi:hypothetical protein